MQRLTGILRAAWIFGERLESITILVGSLILMAVILLTRSEARASTD